MEACERCKFFLKRTEQDGYCRFMPPQVIVTGVNSLGQVAYESIFPIMLNNGACGQWKAKLLVEVKH